MSALAPMLPVLVVLVPLALAALLAVAGARAAIGRLAPLAAVPALVLAVAGGETIAAPWALLGVRLGAVDELGRGFLAFTALLWLVAAWFAHAYLARDPRRTGFWAWFLVTMAGNLGVIVAGDMASFYLWFAVMSLASYGLIIHTRTDQALRAGRVYLVLALFGDVLILAALLAITPGAANLPLAAVPAAAAASPYGGTAALLLLAGFGVKAGAVLPLHVWLPLAHPVAPTPASALLSGAMIKVGLLGWLRFLPLGERALPELGTAWIALGLTAAIYGALNGVTHRDAKTVLAYSSISQMGLMLVVVGIAVGEPRAAGPAQAALISFAAHHALAKAALFLGVAVAREARSPGARLLVTVALAWSALEIAGAPLTGGALAKLSLKEVLALHPDGALLATAMSCAAIGSTLLMARFLYVAVPRADLAARGRPAPGLWLPWALLLAIDTALLVRAPGLGKLVEPGVVWSAAWPVLGGGALALAAWGLGRRGARLPTLPAGDVLVVVPWLLGGVGRGWSVVRATADAAAARLHAHGRRLAAAVNLARWGRRLERADAALLRFPVVGVLLAALAGVLVWALRA